MLTWGNNDSGELGNGQFIRQLEPVEVDQSGVLTGKSISNISAGNSNNLALCSDGSLATWGEGSSGRLGTGSGFSDSTTPVLIGNSDLLVHRKVTSISSGGSHSLVISAVPLNSKLAALSLSSGSLNPPFSPEILNYVASMPGIASGVTVTPTAQSPFSTIYVDGDPVDSGMPSPTVTLSAASDSISIQVESENGQSATTYTVTTPTNITRGFVSASDAPDPLSSYDASGWQATFTLGFHPPTGTSLSVIDNTGIGFIQGRFTNVSQGQVVELPLSNEKFTHFS